VPEYAPTTTFHSWHAWKLLALVGFLRQAAQRAAVGARVERLEKDVLHAQREPEAVGVLLGGGEGAALPEQLVAAEVQHARGEEALLADPGAAGERGVVDVGGPEARVEEVVARVAEPGDREVAGLQVDGVAVEEEADRAVRGARCGDVAERVGVYIVHLGCFFEPVGSAVLDDA
jgi:hypothetical protein